MNYSTGILTDKSRGELINQSSEQMLKYAKYLLILLIWYKERGRILPRTTLTNYKDAMFHYKKLYEHSDVIKVIQEQYAMEEHLIRSHKDAVIQYMNDLRQEIESIYFVFSNNEFLKKLPTAEDCKKVLSHIKKCGEADMDDAFDVIDFNDSRWVIGTMTLMETMGLSEIECVEHAVAIYYYKHESNRNVITEKLQKCIHEIAQFSLQLRTNGTEIYRPMNDDDYNNECVRVFEFVMNTLDEMALRILITVSPKLVIEKKDIREKPYRIVGAKREDLKWQVIKEFLALY